MDTVPCRRLYSSEMVEVVAAAFCQRPRVTELCAVMRETSSAIARETSQGRKRNGGMLAVGVGCGLPVVSALPCLPLAKLLESCRHKPHPASYQPRSPT